jgi:hypothetical protein
MLGKTSPPTETTMLPSPDSTPPFSLSSQSTNISTSANIPIMSGDLRTNGPTKSPNERENSRATSLKKTITDFYPAHTNAPILPNSCRLTKQNIQSKHDDRDPTLRKFLKPQLSSEQPEIRRTYLQAAAQGNQVTSQGNQTTLPTKNKTSTLRNTTTNPPAQAKPPTYNASPQMNLEDQSTYPQAITDTFKNTDEFFSDRKESGTSRSQHGMPTIWTSKRQTI